MNPLACILDPGTCVGNLWDQALSVVNWPWFVTGLIIGALLGKVAVAIILFLLAAFGLWRPAGEPEPHNAAEHFPDGHPDPSPQKRPRLGSKSNPIFGKK